MNTTPSLGFVVANFFRAVASRAETIADVLDPTTGRDADLVPCASAGLRGGAP